MKRIAFLLSMFLTVRTVCRSNGFGGIDAGIMGQTCNTEVKTFDDKESLSQFLKTEYDPHMVCSGEPCIKVYEAMPINYKVTVKTEDRKKETTETVETGRSIKFK